MDGALHGQAGSAVRDRFCDLGYLREVYCKDGDKLGYRCPGEPIKNYLHKGGTTEKAKGKLCLCNGLLATIGLGQNRNKTAELPIVTAGSDFSFLEKLISNSTRNYNAGDVINYLKA